jgi:hypothetical protein
MQGISVWRKKSLPSGVAINSAMVKPCFLSIRYNKNITLNMKYVRCDFFSVRYDYRLQ